MNVVCVVLPAGHAAERGAGREGRRKERAK
jgi:hypothetical protein